MHYVKPSVHKVKSPLKKILSISDLHLPFCDMSQAKDVILANTDAEDLIINGDLFDSYQISTFSKERHIPFLEEYLMATELIDFCAEHFKRVILVDGNHEVGRFQVEIGKLEPSLRFLQKTSPMAYLAHGDRFSKTGTHIGAEPRDNVIYAGDVSDESWNIKIGNCLFAHRIRGYKSGPMANITHMADYFIKAGKSFQCLVAGHSHHAGTAPYLGRLLIDQGCLCQPQGYANSGGCASYPIDAGYAVVYMDASGNVDFSKSRHVYLGIYSQKT